jgi:hypothetical protein
MPRLAAAITMHPAGSYRLKEIRTTDDIRQKSATMEYFSMILLFISKNSSEDLFKPLLIVLFSVSLIINY